MASGDGGDWDLTRINISLKSMEDIQLGLTSVDIDCGARVEICGGGRGLLTLDRRQLTDIWPRSMSVWYFWVGIDDS